MMKSISNHLARLDAIGIPREDSALGLPLGMETTIVCKHNLRNLIDMSHQRMCSRAYHEFREPLNKSSSAGRRIFCPTRAVLKAGNTQSIPPLSELSAETKSSAASSCRFNQSFPSQIPPPCLKNRHGGGFCRYRRGMAMGYNGRIQIQRKGKSPCH